MRSTKQSSLNWPQKFALASLVAGFMSSCLTPSPSSISQPDSSTMNGSSAPGATANFIVDKVEAEVSSHSPQNAWGLPNARVINMKACLIDAATRGTDSLVIQRFSVSDGVSSQSLVTDPNGCIHWSETHEFDYFAPETYVPMPRTITALGPYSGSVLVQLAYNPWQDSPVKDPRYMPSGTIPLDTAAVPLSLNGAVRTSGRSALSFPDAAKPKGSYETPAVLQVKSIAFTFNGLNYGAYEIDRDLNLTVAHDYTVQFAPGALRKGLNDFKPEAPQKGKVRMTFVVATDQGDLNTRPAVSDVLVAESRVAEFSSNLVSENFTIKMPDIARLGARGSIYLEIEPLVESSSLKKMAFSGKIAPLMGSPTAALFPTTVSASELYARTSETRAMLAQKREQISPFDSFLAQVKIGSPLMTSSLSTERETYKTLDLTQNEMVALMAKKLNPDQQALTLRKLCFVAYPNASDAQSLRAKFDAEFRTKGFSRLQPGPSVTSAYSTDRETPLSACLRSPEKAMSAVTREFVEKILSPVPTKAGAVQNIAFSVGATTKVSSTSVSSKSDTTSSKTDVGANAGLSVGFNPSIGKLFTLGVNAGASTSWSIGREWAKSMSHSRTTVNDVSGVVSKGISLSAEANTFRFDALVRRCLFVSAAQAASEKPSFQPFAVCQNQWVEKDQQEETYYLVSQVGGASGSAFSDALDLRDMPMRAFVRGTALFELFKKTMEDPTMEVVFERDPSKSNPATLDLPSTTPLNQEAPGLLSFN